MLAGRVVMGDFRMSLFSFNPLEETIERWIY